jgi:integrase
LHPLESTLSLALPLDDREIILALCSAPHQYAHFQTVLRAALCTGLPIGDLARLRCEHVVDGGLGDLWIWLERRSLRLPVHSAIEPIVRALARPGSTDTYLFEVSGLLHGTPEARTLRLRHQFSRLRNTLKLRPGVGFASARSNVARLLAMALVDWDTVTLLLGMSLRRTMFASGRSRREMMLATGRQAIESIQYSPIVMNLIAAASKHQKLEAVRAALAFISDTRRISPT